MECGCQPSGLWKTLAKETLEVNQISVTDFASAVLTLIKIGRSKGRNILLIGRTNCGKSFLLRPLERVYNSLSNPATNTFSFSDVINKEVIFLDDFRYNRGKPLAWKDLFRRHAVGVRDTSSAASGLVLQAQVKKKFFFSASYCVRHTQR